MRKGRRDRDPYTWMSDPQTRQHVARPGETQELQEVCWERDGTSGEPDLCHGDQASGEGS